VLGQSVSYAGVLVDASNGSTTFNLGRYTLSLSGKGNAFTGAFGTALVTGTGTMTLGSVSTTTLSSMTLGGTETLQSRGIVNQTGLVTLGDGSGAVANVANTGTWTIANPSTLQNGASAASQFTNSGVFVVTAGTGTATLNTTFVNAGTLNVASGALQSVGTLANTGTIKGSDLQLTGSSQTTLGAGTALTVGELDVLDTATLTFSLSLTYAGFFNDSTNGSSFVNLNGQTLTLSGGADFYGHFGQAGIGGGGTIVTAGTTGLGNIYIGAGTTFDNTGTVNATGPLQVGDGSSAPAAAVNAGTYDLTADTGISNGAAASSTFTNTGLFEKTGSGGTSTLATVFTNSGTVSVQTGIINTTGTFTDTGVVKGTELEISAGVASFNAGAQVVTGQLDLYNSATLSLGANLGYSGIFNDLSGGSNVVALNGHVLTLTGTAALIGTFGSTIVTNGGTLFTKGTTSLAQAQIGAGTTLRNSGTINATGQLVVGDGSANAGTVTNQGTYDFANDTGISHGASLLSSFTNSGLFEKTAGTGTSVVSTQFTNSGTITVTSGTIEFSGGFSNSGVINGTLTTDGSGNTFIHA
jgi:hypothetical protein